MPDVVRVVPAQFAVALRYTRRASADHSALCVPVQSFASIGCAAPLASIVFDASTLPSCTVATFTTSAFDVGVMHTTGALLGTSASGAAAVQQPSHPCQRDPLACCAAPVAAVSETSAAAMAAVRVAWASRFIVTLICRSSLEPERDAKRDGHARQVDLVEPTVAVTHRRAGPQITRI